MRIKSDFRDYYDTVQATGQDQSLLYVRKRIEEPLRNWPFETFHTYETKVTGRSQVVGFCGKIYPTLKMIEQEHPESDRAKVCYSLAEVDAFMDEVMVEAKRFDKKWSFRKEPRK